MDRAECRHDFGTGQATETPGGSVRVVRFTCDDCGASLGETVEHSAETSTLGFRGRSTTVLWGEDF